MVALAASPFASPQIAREVLFARLRGVAARRDTKGWGEKEKLLLDGCHPFQKPFVQDEARRIVVLCSGRAGKTTGGRVRFLRRMMRKRGAKCLFIAKSAPAAEDLMWAPLKETAERLGLEARFREDRLRCTLIKNGSTLRLVGADDTAEIDKLRGQPFDEVGIDEAASHKPELLQYLIEQAVGPRLGDYRGTLWLAGTPGSILRGLFYELTMPGSERSLLWSERDKHPHFRGWSMHWWNMEQAAPYATPIANAWAEALEQKALNGWSDQHPTWRREYLGEWAADDTQMMFRFRAAVDADMVEQRPELVLGAPWNEWEPERDDLGIAVLPKARGEWHYSIGLDLGGGRASGNGVAIKAGAPTPAGDPTAIEVWAWDDQDPAKTLYHVYEFHSRDRLSLRQLAQIFLGEECSLTAPEGLFGRLGWPDGMIADIGSLGGMVLQEMANVYGISIEPAQHKHRHDAVEGMNGDLIDGRAKIMKGTVLWKQLQDLQWEIDRYGLTAKNKRQRNDAADAGCYGRAIAAHLLSETQAHPPVRENKFERVGKEREPEPVRGEFDEWAGSDDDFGADGDWG
jgi:hypothetical protein